MKSRFMLFSCAMLFVLSTCVVTAPANAWTISSGSGGDCLSLGAGASWDAASNKCTVTDAVASSPSNYVRQGATLVVNGLLTVPAGKTLHITGGSLVISASARLENAGTINITDSVGSPEVEILGEMENESVVVNNGDFEISGSVENKRDGSITNTLHLDIKNGGKLENKGALTNTSSGNTTAKLTNAGQLINTGSSDNNKAIITNEKNSEIINEVEAKIENMQSAQIVNDNSTVRNQGDWLNQDHARIDNQNGALIWNIEKGKLRVLDSVSFRNSGSVIVNGDDALIAIRRGSSLSHDGSLILNKNRLAVTDTGIFVVAAPATLLQFCGGVLNTNGGKMKNDGTVVNFGGTLPAGGIPGSGTVQDMPWLCIP